MNGEEVKVVSSTDVMEVEAMPQVGRWSRRRLDIAKNDGLALWGQFIPKLSLRLGKGHPLVT